MSLVVRLTAPDELQVADEQVAGPGPGQVRIVQEAIGVNFVDTYFRSGRFPLPAYPAVIGGEGVGVIDAVGNDVDLVVGQRVGYYFSLGSYAQTRLLLAADAIPLPDDLPSVQAAALLAKGLTAWGRLRPVKQGDVILVTGATGGVGSMLATWAQHLGATVITPVASEARAEAARALGLRNVVVAGRLAGQSQVDVFYDLVGQATFKESIQLLKDGGTLDLIGSASGAPDLDEADLARRRITVTRSSTGDHLPDRATLLTAADELFAAWRAGVFGPRSIRTYPLAEVAQAHRDLEAGIPENAVVLLP
ncbi:zinc-binding dehydrogenase [Kribbella sp. DT2]|uniref:zinc-binding dehydrogenase n=1 Tax=Kribbella sp. DT2 TaxID=3393427 RepID=UPI003CE9CECC